MEWGIGCCCGCIATVGFWGTYDQSYWDTHIDFPDTWTKLYSRSTSNLTDCEILVVGRYQIAPPYTAQPTTTAERDAVADWVTAGGVLIVMHDYYGSPSIRPSSVVTDLNAFLSYIGTDARAVATAGPAPNLTNTPLNQVVTTSVTHDLLTGVDKLWLSAPGHMSYTVPPSTLIFEARKTILLPYVPVLTIEDYGSGKIVFWSDFSMVNNPDAYTAIAARGNKINVLLANFCSLVP